MSNYLSRSMERARQLRVDQFEGPAQAGGVAALPNVALVAGAGAGAGAFSVLCVTVGASGRPTACPRAQLRR